MSCLVWISGYCTFIVVNFLNKILESTKSNRNASLKVKLIMRGEKENSEMLLENSKNTLNNIACLSMTKVEQFLGIFWAIRLLYVITKKLNISQSTYQTPAAPHS